MATTHGSQPPGTAPARPDRPRRFRWTSEQYYRLADQGFFDDRRVELINGEIWEMTTNPPHSIASELLAEAMRVVFGGGGYRFRIQQPLDLGRRNQVEPDMAILRGSPRDVPSHPSTALLVIEISDTTLRKDRVIKSHLYARAGIPDYWIVNLVDRQLEIRRQPGPDPSRRGRFTYADVTIVAATGTATPLAAPRAVIAVADLLP